jgi:hypothetical protein
MGYLAQNSVRLRFRTLRHTGLLNYYYREAA